MRSLKYFNPSSHLLNEDRILSAPLFPISIRLGLCKVVRCVTNHTGRDSGYGAADGRNPVGCIPRFTRDPYAVWGAKGDPAKHGTQYGAYDADQSRIALGYVVLESIHATPRGASVIVGILA
jgi:hypothetical protein